MRWIHEIFIGLLFVLIPLASFVTGLVAPPPRGKRLWQRPVDLTRALLAVLVIEPLWAGLIVSLIPLSPVVQGGLLVATISVGIGPVAGLNRMSASKPHASDALDLNLVVLVISMVFVPVMFAVVAALYHRILHLGLLPVAKVVLGRALVPLLVGLLVSRASPRFAIKAGPSLAKIIDGAMALLLLVAIAATWRRLSIVGVAGWLSAVAIAAGAVALGHWLGGPNPNTRAAVAMSSVLRFPALALALASAVPQGRRATPVIVAYLMAALLVLAVYGLLTQRGARVHRLHLVPSSPAV